MDKIWYINETLTISFTSLDSGVMAKQLDFGRWGIVLIMIDKARKIRKMKTNTSQNYYDNCDVALIIIPGWEFILCTCDIDGSLALDPPQNKF